MKRFLFARTDLVALILVSLVYFLLNWLLALHCTDPDFRTYGKLVKSLLAASLLPLICLSLPRLLGALLLTTYSFFLLFWLSASNELNGSLFSGDNILGFEQIDAILSTNSYEIKSYLVDNCVLVILLVALLVGLFLLSLKFCRLHKKRLFWSLALSIVFLAIAGKNSVHRYYSTDSPIVAKSSNKIDICFTHFLVSNRGMTGISIYSFYKEFFFRPHQAKPHVKRDSLITGSLKTKEKNIILVIGESATDKRHGFIDQSLSTTPMMNSQIFSGHACPIKQAHSSGNETWTAIPFITTFMTPSHTEKRYTEKNIVELAHDAGYYTSWISAQYGGGEYADSQGYIRQFSDNLVAPDNKTGKYHPHADLELLTPLRDALSSDNHSNKFIVLHLVGSHQSYSDKYDNEDVLALPHSSEYDRSIHHTDRFLAKVIELANQKLGNDFVLFYTSDHGQDLVRNEHALDRGSSDQYHIPVLIAYGNQSGSFWCKEADSLRTEEHNFPQTMDKVILSEMLGYSVDPEQLKAIKKHDRVLHSNNVVYEYNNIPTTSFKGIAAID